jgi:CheY-like chemotaxis protein
VRLVQKLLQSRPWISLIHAPDGRAGLEAARTYRPDLVLLDLHLPDMPGHEVHRRLAADPVLGGVPVVILSADATPVQVQRALSGGAAAYLTKPLDLRQVLQVIDRVLDERDIEVQPVPEVSE